MDDRGLASRAIGEWLWFVGELQRRAPAWCRSEGLLKFERWANDYLAWNARSG